MKLSTGKPAEPYWMGAAAGALMLGGPVWHYLYVNHYSFGRAEALVLPVAAGLIGAGVGVVGLRMGPWLGSLAFGALLYLFLDLQFDPQDWTYTVAVVGACLLVAAILRHKRATLSCITLGTFYLASLPRSAQVPPLPPSADASPRSGALPVLVHLILDEQWGIGGLRAEGDTATAAFLSEFYQTRGFEVYEAAYSRSPVTNRSIPEMISLGNVPSFHDPVKTPAFVRSMQSIPYFERLGARGYAIRVYQSTYLDYCHAAGLPVLSCKTESGNSIANIGRLHGAWTARAALATRYLLTQTSYVYKRLRRPPSNVRPSTVGGGLDALERARDAIALTPPGGTVFFVHALLPHRPVELDARCDAVSDPSWREDYDQPAQRSDSSWRQALLHLGGQIRCAHHAVAEVLDALDSTVGREHSIVIIHGDHGSRMRGNVDDMGPLSTLSGRELNALHSTLLAVRRPGVPAALYPEAVPIQDFLWELVRNDFKGAVRKPWRHFVRDNRPDKAHSDTVRTLTEAEMLWVDLSRRVQPVAVSSGRGS